MSNVHVHVKDMHCKSRLHALEYGCYVACCWVHTGQGGDERTSHNAWCNLIFYNHHVDKPDISHIKSLDFIQFLTLSFDLLASIFVFRVFFTFAITALTIFLINNHCLHCFILGDVFGVHIGYICMCLCSCRYGTLLGSAPPLVSEGTLIKSTYNSEL